MCFSGLRRRIVFDCRMANDPANITSTILAHVYEVPRLMKDFLTPVLTFKERITLGGLCSRLSQCLMIDDHPLNNSLFFTDFHAHHGVTIR